MNILLNLQSGWLRYSTNDALQNLMGIDKNDIIMLEEKDEILLYSSTSTSTSNKTSKQTSNNGLSNLLSRNNLNSFVSPIANTNIDDHGKSKGLLYLLSKKHEMVRIMGTDQMGSEMERSYQRHHIYRKEFFLFLKDIMDKLLVSLHMFLLKEKKSSYYDEIEKYEYPIRVILTTLMNDEHFEFLPKLMLRVKEQDKDDLMVNSTFSNSSSSNPSSSSSSFGNKMDSQNKNMNRFTDFFFKSQQQHLNSLDKEQANDLEKNILFEQNFPTNKRNGLLANVDLFLSKGGRLGQQAATTMNLRKSLESSSKERTLQRINSEHLKMFEIMNWRKFEILSDVGLNLWNLWVGLRLMKRLNVGSVEFRQPSLSPKQILFGLQCLSEHRNGRYFPKAPKNISPLGYIYLQNVYLDELGFHLWGIQLLEIKKAHWLFDLSFKYPCKDPDDIITDIEEGELLDLELEKQKLEKIYLMTVLNVEKEKGEKRGEEEEGEKKKNLIENFLYEEEEEEEEREEGNISLPHHRSFQNPNKIYFIKEKLNSQIEKRVRAYESMLIDYNIKKIHEKMKHMEFEQDEELLLLKTQETYLLGEDGESSIMIEHNTVDDVLQNMLRNIKLEGSFELKLKSNLNTNPPVDDELMDLTYEDENGKKQILQDVPSFTHQPYQPHHPFNQQQITPSAAKFKQLIEKYMSGKSSSSNSMLLKNSATSTLNQQKQHDQLTDSQKRAKRLADNNLQDIEDIKPPLTAKERERLEMDNKNVEDVLKEIYYVGIQTSSWTIAGEQYKLPINYDQHEMLMKVVCLEKLRLVNEKETIKEFHFFLTDVIFNDLWKRESYRRSGRSKPNTQSFDSWEYVEKGYLYDTYLSNSPFEPLINVLNVYYPKCPFMENLLDDNRGKLYTDNNIGVFINGFYESVMELYNKEDFSDLLFGDFLHSEKFVYKQHLNNFICYWWIKTQLNQANVDVNRSIFFFDIEIEYLNLYRGYLFHPTISKMGKDWVVVIAGTPDVQGKKLHNDWLNKNGKLNVVNCGESLFQAFHCWLFIMDRYAWKIEERRPSLKVWNENLEIKESDHHLKNRRGRVINIIETNIFKLYFDLKNFKN